MTSFQKFITGLCCAFVIKGTLLFFTAAYAPQGKFANDSEWYMQAAESIAREGRFVIPNGDGTYRYEMYRTPGYPLFLAVVWQWAHCPLEGVLAVQLLLNLASAWLVYWVARRFNEGAAPLAALIIAFDPAITVYSSMVLTESLFLFLIALFLFVFVRYLETGSVRRLMVAALLVVAATYVRPVAYFLGGAVAGFLLFGWGSSWKRGILHAVTFFVIVYALIGAWQYRNYVQNGQARFTTVDGAALETAGLVKSYGRHADVESRHLPPWAYYVNVTGRSVISLFTRPESFKSWKMKPLTVAGKVVSYPWIAFWLTGFLVGLSHFPKDRRMFFIGWVLLYFATVIIVAAMWNASARFRIPMMPSAAIISALGWRQIRMWWGREKSREDEGAGRPIKKLS